MPSQTLEYPKQSFSTVNRKNTRASYSLEQIHQIINTSLLLNVSFNTPDSPFPQVLPMIGQMGSFERPSADTGDVLDLYLHGYVSSRIINLSRQAADGAAEGLPMTVAASHVDGLVLALTPNSHSYNYRSAVLFGHATLVTDVAEKLYAMELITDSVVRDRWRHTRVPPNGAEMQSTSVLKLKIAAGSAKIRSGPPGDDKADEENEELLDRVWTGVVPVQTTLGELIPGPLNRLGKPPAYLTDYVQGFNKDAKDTAVEQAKEAAKP